MAYPTRAQIAAASSNAQLLALTNDQQDALRAAAITNVESYTGQTFEPEGTAEAPVTKVLSGTGGPELYLPTRLESMSGVNVAGGSPETSQLAVSDDGDVLYFTPTGTSTWVERALRDLSTAGWPRGRRNVSVSGVWGWSECPPAVVTAIRFDMEDAATAESAAIAPSLRAWAKLGLSSMSQGPLSVQLENRPMVLSPRAADQLDSAGLVWQRVGEVV